MNSKLISKQAHAQTRSFTSFLTSPLMHRKASYLFTSFLTAPHTQESFLLLYFFSYFSTLAQESFFLLYFFFHAQESIVRVRGRRMEKALRASVCSAQASVRWEQGLDEASVRWGVGSGRALMGERVS